MSDVNKSSNEQQDSGNQDSTNDNDMLKLKNKLNKLSPFAPEFDAKVSPIIDPYGGQYGISTQPVYVPPAQIHNGYGSPLNEPTKSADIPLQHLNTPPNQALPNSGNYYRGGPQQKPLNNYMTNTINPNLNKNYSMDLENNNDENGNTKMQQQQQQQQLQSNENGSPMPNHQDTNSPNSHSQEQQSHIQNQHPTSTTTGQGGGGGGGIRSSSPPQQQQQNVNSNIPQHQQQQYPQQLPMSQLSSQQAQAAAAAAYHHHQQQLAMHQQGGPQQGGPSTGQQQQHHHMMHHHPPPPQVMHPHLNMHPHGPVHPQMAHLQNGGSSLGPSGGNISQQLNGMPNTHLTRSQIQFPTIQQQLAANNRKDVGYTTKPPPEAIDPVFTNPSDYQNKQKWELLESAKRWLPGEGTFTMWKDYRYVVGKPIHMGMNGHIHYCYRYKLGENSQEKVALSKKPPRPEVVAAKVVPNTPAFAREIVILRALQGCENITKLYEVLESERTLLSILELAQADVYNFFVGRGAKKHGWNLEKPAVREHFARMVVSNVVQGLKQMHDKEYLHCDLKSLNILLYIYSTQGSSKRGGVYMKAKLTDFGHSSHGKIRLAEKLFSNGMARVGTAGHVAPELFKEGSRCDLKIDIWSLGIVMFSMLVPGRLLFGEYTNLDTLKQAYDRLNNMNPYSRETRPSWWTDFERLSPESRDLILWMTRFDAKDRPHEDQILKHPWFTIIKAHKKPGCYRPKLEFVDRLCSSSIAQE